MTDDDDLAAGPPLPEPAWNATPEAAWDDDEAAHAADLDELPDDVVDARFRELTADLEDPEIGPGAIRRRVWRVDPARQIGAGPRDWPTSAEVEALEDAETYFTPPNPPRLQIRQHWSALAWLGVVVSVLWSIANLVLPRTLTGGTVFSILSVVAGALFVASLAYLIYHMPKHRDPTNHNGAVV